MSYQPPTQQPAGQMPPPGQQPPPYAMPGGDPWAAQPQQPPGPPLGSPPPPPPPPPGAPYGAPPPEPMWQPPPAFPLAPDAYPVNVSYDREATINRLWGIPLVGQLVRFVLLIPHFFIIMLLGIVAFVQVLFSWIPVLLLGRYPGWGYRWTGGLLAYSQRVGAYALLMTPEYPPFALEAEMFPVSVRFDEGVRINRAWGIPVIGHIVRWLVLIPHWIVLSLLSFLAFVLMLFVWVPVLILGRQADAVYTFIGGVYRWNLRVNAYALMMVDKYPPFSLGEDDPRL